MKRRQAVATLIAGALVALALLTVFAVELSNNQSSSVKDIESRVHERSVLAGALIDSLFQTSSRSSLALDERLYGGAHVTTAAMNRARQTDRYLVLLSPSGSVLAHSAGFDAIARADLRVSAALKLLRAGRPWAVGNVLTYPHGGVINYGIALPTRYGTRYLLTGFSPAALGPFLLGELRQIPGVRGAHNFVLDANGVVLASTNPRRPTGYVFHTPAQLSVLHHASGTVSGRYFDQVPLADTSWRILLTAPSAPLFASVSGVRKWLPWAIFAAFALVALLSLALAQRILRSSEKIRQAHGRLELAHVRLEEMHSELARSNAALERRAIELQRSNAELDQFASIASHDLQEPLRKVRTFTERIRETEGDDLSERSRDYLQRASASAARMQQLIEDLLRFSRVATHGRPFSDVDLGAVTAEVLDDLDDVVRSSEAVIRVGELPTVSADPLQMRQLLQNLISNAIKFRREDVAPEIEISGEQSDGWVKLVVRDNGIGFDQQYARRIFRVFERLHGRGAYPGTGIGLALCRKIAERHGGGVVADSRLGEGSTFTVTLQAGRTEAVAAPPTAGPHGEPAPTEEPYVAV